MKRLILTAIIFLLSAIITFAQDFCKGDFNYNGSVGAEDVEVFLEHFGRSQFNNPCPPDGPSPVPKTGRTTSYATGDDGDLQRGVALETPRFTDNADGTVADNQTGLIWLKDALCDDLNDSGNGLNWYDALTAAASLASGSCGLTDGSSGGDWRLPNYKELFSLIDAENFNPALPSGHPFTNVQDRYWSSTTIAFTFDVAWLTSLATGFHSSRGMGFSHYVWPVRGGH